LGNELKIGQITDTHVMGRDVLYQGIDVCGNFLAALDSVCAENPDLIVLSGDLAAEDAERDAYQWIREQMDGRKFPYVVMVGNHDRVEVMRDYYDIGEDIHNGKLYFHREIKGKHLFFLDSGNHILDDFQWKWMEEKLKDIDEEVLVFMHHPPAFSGHKFMDAKYALENIDETREWLSKFPQIRNIFVGHYHTEKFLIQDGKNIHITPSTAMQIDSHFETFKMEHIRPGWRMIEWNNGRIDTEVHYALERPTELDDKTFF